MDSSRIDQIRRRALDSVDVMERRFKLLLVVTAMFEGALLVTFLLLMDMGQRLHWLLLVGAVLVYGTLGLGLVLLAMDGRRNTQLVLQAVERHDDPGTDEESLEDDR